MNTKWTPGPWVLIDSPDNDDAAHCVDAIDPKDGVIFEVCAVWGEGRFEARTEMSLANAHLIAAAPDLYEALESSIPMLDQLLRDSGISEDEIGGILYPKITALAKARGES